MPGSVLLGTPVAAHVTVTGREALVPVGDWESGLYFARIVSPAG